MSDATICLDTMPFGRFLEIEGSPGTIMRIVHDVELRWEHRILSSYLGIFETLREKERLPFSDVTFDNFKTISIPFDRYAHLFEAGDGGGI